MPLPERPKRSPWAYVTLVMFVAALAAIIASIVMGPTGDEDKPHRPPHVTSTK